MDSDDYFPNYILQVAIDQPEIAYILVIVFTFVLFFICSILSIGEKALYHLSPEDISHIKDEKNLNDKIIKLALERSRQLQNSIYIAQVFIHIFLPTLGFYLLHSLLPNQIISFLEYTLIALGYVLIIILLTCILPRLIIKKDVLNIVRKTTPLLIACEWIFRPLSQFMSLNIIPKLEIQTSENSIIAKDSLDEKEMLEEIIHFYNKTVDEIMVPRLDMIAVDIESSFKEILDLIAKTGYSRFPVYEETEDNIKGVLYVKDMLKGIANPNSFNWKDIIRAPYFVPETKKIEDLLEEFRKNKVHIAIIVDEFGCTSGLVTMEDIIEEIIGEIADEYDTDEKLYLKLPDGSYILEGKIQLNDFFRETEIEPSEFGKMVEEVDTLAGLLLKIKGSLPKRRELIEYKNYHFRILEADDRRVLKIKFSISEHSNKKKKSSTPLLFLIFMLLIVSCTEYTPKPRGQIRIDVPESEYTTFTLEKLPYSFKISQLATIELPPTGIEDDWINIAYPAFNAKIYCSYKKITPTSFHVLDKENKELVIKSIRNADEITEHFFENPEKSVYGSFFQINGETASPLQFVLTDSITNFFRGALYYECKYNADSLAPVTKYIQTHITELIESFRWK